MPKSKTVQIYPVPGVSFYPWRPIQQEVTAAQWAELRKVRPPPFTDRPPGEEPERPTEPSDGSPDPGGSD